jgi:TorA maturation chaperone TorD
MNASESPVQAHEVEQMRAAAWSLLGNLLAAPPSEDLLALLRQIGGAEIAGDDAMGRAWQALRLAAQRAAPPEMEQEYQELFIGVGGGELTPYASWYRTGSVYERPLVELRQDLQTLGVERQEGVSEPEDHAGAVCQVMALLVVDSQTGFEGEKAFFNRHLEPWLGRLFEDLQQAQAAVFYRAVGAVGSAFFDLERKYFSMLG